MSMINGPPYKQPDRRRAPVPSLQHSDWRRGTSFDLACPIRQPARWPSIAFINTTARSFFVIIFAYAHNIRNIMDINLLAVVVCTFAAFIVSTIWYMALGKTRAQLLGLDLARERRPKPQNILLELLRTFILALVFAIVLSELKDSSLHASVLLGLRLWLAFPFILLSGSVLWDNVPKKLAMIHAGDWLLKILLIALIIGAWR
jgi:hypothetical protein